MRHVLIGVIIALPLGLAYEYIIAGPYPGMVAASLVLTGAFCSAIIADQRKS